MSHSPASDPMSFSSSSIHPSETQYPLWDALESILDERLGPELIQSFRSKRLHTPHLSPLSSHESLFYQTLGKEDGPVLVLANGLGGRLYTWLPVIEAFAHEYKVIVWDYRGLFDSSPSVLLNQENQTESSSKPSSEKDQANASLLEWTIPQHAQDLNLILEAEGVEKAHICGWSMGVQVSLEFASRFANKVQSLILINGTYGQVFSTAFQPFFKAPIPTRLLHHVVEGLKQREGLTKLGLKGSRWGVDMFFFMQKRLSSAFQSSPSYPFMTLAARQYCQDLFSGDHLQAYLTFFQHLDAHSVYHILPLIQAPTLVVSGSLDFLTPSYQSKLIARRLPNAHHEILRWGSHFVLLEHPQKVVDCLKKHFQKVS